MSKIVVISSPSGCGKDTVLKELLNYFKESRKIITSTTRSPRLYEQDGIHYHFLKKEDFLKKIENVEFIEWQDVFGELYGITKEEINIKSECSFIILDVLGAMRLKNILNQSPILIFLKPPSKEILIERLEKRGSESKEDIQKRMERYEMEIEMSKLYDAVVINEKLDETISEITTIIQSYV